MSLIGSLEDLGLGDILQIINLSQKSGVLSIRGVDAEGRIVFRDGMVRAAGLKGGPEDLRGLLVESGFVSQEEFETARGYSEANSVSLAEGVAEATELSIERIESLRRETVEAAVAEMFAWRAGEFSFDVGGGEEWEKGELALSTGLNAQYLAMESVRVSDEDGRDGGGDAPSENSLNLDLPADEMFGVGDASGEAAAEPTKDSDLTEPEIAAAQPADDESALGTLVSLTTGKVSADADREELLTAEIVEGEADGDEPILELIDVAPADVDEVGLDVTAQLELSEPNGEDGFELAAPEPVETVDLGASDGGYEIGEPVGDAGFESAEPEEPSEADVTQIVEPEEPLEAESDDVTELDGSSVCEAATIEEPAAEAAAPMAEPPPPGQRPPVIVIDPNLAILGWVRDALTGTFQQVHIFQRSQEGLGRIRQYLARAQSPMLLVSPGIEGDPLSGIADASDFVVRLRKQAPRMPVVWLMEAGAQLDASLRDAAVGVHPPIGELGAPEAEHTASYARDLGELLLSELGRQTRRSEAAAERGESEGGQGDRRKKSSEQIEHLKSATRALSEASSRGEVLPLVIRFASESYSRVAMFMVRGESVSGMAQAGFDLIGGPDDLEMRAISVPVAECSWFREVIETRTSVRGGAREDGDRSLLHLLGASETSDCHASPILSGDRVVALLFAVSSAGDPGVRDTSALEVVLQHAGLALERAALERALAEIEDESEA